MNNNKMSSIIFIISIVFGLLVLSGCGQIASTSTQTPQATPAVTLTPQQMEINKKEFFRKKALEIIKEVDAYIVKVGDLKKDPANAKFFSECDTIIVELKSFQSDIRSGKISGEKAADQWMPNGQTIMRKVLDLKYKIDDSKATPTP